MLLTHAAFFPPDVFKDVSTLSRERACSRQPQHLREIHCTVGVACRDLAEVAKALEKRGLGSDLWHCVPSENWILPTKRFPALPVGPQTHPPVLFVRFVGNNNLHGHASQIAGGHNSRKVAVKRSSNCTVAHLRCKDCQMMHQRALWCCWFEEKREREKNELTKITWNFLRLLKNKFP